MQQELHAVEQTAQTEVTKLDHYVYSYGEILYGLLHKNSAGYLSIEH